MGFKLMAPALALQAHGPSICPAILYQLSYGDLFKMLYFVLSSDQMKVVCQTK